MKDEAVVKILIESELYKYIRLIKDTFDSKKAEGLIEQYIDNFKETVSKKYKVEDIDKLIRDTLGNIKEEEERNSR